VHFFAVYLAETILCSLDDPGYGTIVRALDSAVSFVVISFLIWMRSRARSNIWSSVTRPLIDVSIVAVILSSVPLLIVRACLPAAG
jgi:hypothetical protein